MADQVRMEVVARRVQRIVFALCGKELDVPPHLFWNHDGIPMVIALEKSFSCSRNTALKTHEEEKWGHSNDGGNEAQHLKHSRTRGSTALCHRRSPSISESNIDAVVFLLRLPISAPGQSCTFLNFHGLQNLDIQKDLGQGKEVPLEDVNKLSENGAEDTAEKLNNGEEVPEQEIDEGLAGSSNSPSTSHNGESPTPSPGTVSSMMCRG